MIHSATVLAVTSDFYLQKYSSAIDLEIFNALPSTLLLQFTSLLGAIAFLVDAVINFLAMRGDSEEIVVCCFSPWQPELTI